jgi:hypothetical protein
MADPEIPTALDGSPAQAFASHNARASAIAKAYADSHPLPGPGTVADENNTIAIIAHLHVLSESAVVRHGIQPAGETPEGQAILKAIRALKPDKRVGTAVDEEILGVKIKIPGDYDMAIKGLMVITSRYRKLLSPETIKHILDTLVPAHLRGAHEERLETLDFQVFEVPETENHLLMINSSRYLVNQLLFDRGGEARFNNATNGLARWLVGYMSTIARHDFLEFNARPYQRLALHAILNLHEFARDESVRTAAHILLDYSFMKYAVSSSRTRRVCPFRRLKENTNSLTKLNDLIREGHGGDPVTGFFLAFSGLIDADGLPIDRFPESWAFNALLAGLAAYRPPPAAYFVAMSPLLRGAIQHRFYHGVRPRLRGSPEDAEGGVEIYYRSPSFLMTAGGMFLTSGYGRDEILGFKQNAVAQATTLIPVREDLFFADLIRFESYPDWRRAVNTAVHLGFACGANLRPAPRRTLPDSSSHAPALAALDSRLLLGWKGSGNEQLNLAEAFITSKLGFDGVEGTFWTRTLADTTAVGPGLAAGLDRIFVAWKGAGNDNLNLLIADSRENKIETRMTFDDTSHHAPAIAFHGGAPFIAWTGRGNGNLNIAKAVLVGAPGSLTISRLTGKVTLGDTSEAGPALASHGGRLAIAWKGAGNDNLNLAFSADGAQFDNKITFGETSHHGPAIASHKGELLLAWIGRGAGNLNIARVVMNGNAPAGLADKVVLGDTSDDGPALASTGRELALGWRGSGNDQLNLRISIDGAFHDTSWIIPDLRHLGVHVAAYRTPPADPDQLDTPIESLGFIYAMEASDLPFEQFSSRILSRNTHLPAKLAYGGRYMFHAPDNRDFAFYLHPSLDKYRARVVRTDEPNPVADFTTMALVEGPYLSAPDGHEGVIEIRHPGYEEFPIVLDFRDPERPFRQDNFKSFPAPWFERAAALAAFSQKLGTAGQIWQEQRALRDACEILERLVALDATRFGPELSKVLMLSLERIGIDYSVSETDLRDWLGDPLHTPYPAIAEALLEILDGRRFKRPIFVDVIAWNYEHAPGVASPRKRRDVKDAVLRAAVLEGHATRHGDAAAEFASLLK